MKKLTALFVVVFAVAFSSNVFAQNSKTISASASATLITAIDITKSSDLLFGKIAKNTNSAGTVTIGATDELTIAYLPTTMATTLATRSAAKFTITGETGQNFSIILPATVALTGPNSSTMSIATSMNLNPANNVLTDGSVPLYVGGVLSITSAQELGQYNGSFAVTVAYN